MHTQILFTVFQPTNRYIDAEREPIPTEMLSPRDPHQGRPLERTSGAERAIQA
jgi:hypothetical protein